MPLTPKCRWCHFVAYEMAMEWCGQHKETIFHPLIFKATGQASCAPHPIDELSWDVSLFQ
jgi:hypothetical protein